MRQAKSDRFTAPAIAIFTVALLMRAWHLWQIRDAPFFTLLLGDSRAYDEWAQRLAMGDWVGTEVFYQAPLYPYFLGVLYALAGRDLVTVRVCQAIIGSLACVALGIAGWRIFSKRVGIAAGLMLALYAPAIFFDGLIQKATLDVFFMCAVVALIGALIDDPARTRSWLWLGVMMGALSLTRENAIVLVVVVFVWALARGAGRITEKRAGPALFALGLALVLLPVAWRNLAVGGHFYLTTSQFGANFYIGNNPRADGTYAPLRFGRGSPEYEREDATELAERAEGRVLTPAEVSRHWTRRALSFIRSQPSAWLALLGRKIMLLWNAGEMLDTESQETHAEWSVPLRAGAHVWHFGLLVPLAVFGIWATWPERARIWILYAMTAAYAASVVVFYVFARYRYPLVPFVLLFASAGIASAPRVVRTSSRPQLIAVAVVIAVVAVLVNRPLLSTELMRAISETNLAVGLHEARRLDEAAARYRKAIAIRPAYAPAHNNLGATLRAQGRLNEAIAEYEEALRHYPGYASASRNLVNALRERGNDLALRGALDAAAADLRRAVAVENNDGLRYDLGRVLLDAGRYREAADEFRAALRLKPTPEAHNNLGIALGSLGYFDQAISEFQAALALEPGFPDAQRNLATARRVIRSP